MKKFFKFILLLLMSITLVSCNTLKDINEEPIDINQSALDIISINDKDKNLNTYLEQYDYFIPQDGSSWDPNLFVMIALYYNKNLALKRKEYGLIASDSQVLVAGYKKNILSPLVEYHSEGKPFTLGLSLEIPRNNISIKEAKMDLIKIKSITKALEVTKPAWQLRTNVLSAIIGVLKYEDEHIIMKKIIAKVASNFKIIDNLYKQGLISNLELGMQKKELEEITSNLNIIKARIKASRINLASIMNVPISMVTKIKISSYNEKIPIIEDVEEVLNKKLHFALMNRGEVLTSLSKYAEAESELRLTILEENKIVTSISPAILWDQTDLIFNLSGSLLLNNDNLSNAKVSRVLAKRDVYKASFEATQSLILNQVQSSYAKMLVVNAEYYAALALLENAKLNLTIMMERKNKGDVSKLNVMQTELLVLKRENLISKTKYSRMLSLLNLENSLGQSYFKGNYLPKNTYYPIDYFSKWYESDIK